MIPWTSPNPSVGPPFPYPLFVREGTMDGDTIQSAAIEDEYCVRGIIEPGDVVVDCGAYVGGFSALALSLGAIVHAVEPSRENCRMVMANTSTWSDRFKLHRGALSSRPGPIELHCTPELGNVHRFMGNTVAPDGGSVIEMVPTLALDDVLDDLFIVKVIKTDCEGGEWDAFRDVASENLLKAEEIVGEIHPRHGETQDEAFAAFLKLLPGFRLVKRHAMLAWFER